MKTVPPFSTTATARSPRRFLETLVRSEEGRVTLLPALPDFLRDGELKGVCLRGAFHLEKLTFSDGKVTRCDIYSEKGGALDISANGRLYHLDAEGGQDLYGHRFKYLRR